MGEERYRPDLEDRSDFWRASLSDRLDTVAAMSMFPFHAVFPRLALRETRNLTFPKGRPGLPADLYGLIELYCVEPGCDCRRVMLNVLSARTGEHVATINFGFGRDDEARGPFLDPLNVQSRLSPALLVQVREHLMEDPAYVARLERHYRMVKDALADPTHEIHELVSRGLTPEEELAEAEATLARVADRVGRNDPCPCGSGRKFKRCCLTAPASRGGAP